VLEAVAAAARGDQLGEHARVVDPDRPVEHDVEVLERDAMEVRPHDRVERREVGLRDGGAGQPDPGEVGVEIDRHRGERSAWRWRWRWRWR
jgi:hypothetical protein